MKVFLVIVSFVIIWFTVSIVSFFVSDNGYLKEVVKYEKLLGDTLVINNKEYIITDYSFMDSNVILDNGGSVYINEVEKYLK